MLLALGILYNSTRVRRRWTKYHNREELFRRKHDFKTACVYYPLTLQFNDLHPLSFNILTNKLKTLFFKVVLQLRIHLN